MKRPHLFPLSAFVFGLAAGFSPAGVRITEVVTNNLISLADEDGDSPDWLELHNDGTEAVSLEGFFLTDSPDDLNRWELPAENLAAGGYLVVFASGKNRSVAGQELHTDFQLKNGGEYLALVDPDNTTVVDAYDPEIPQLGEDESFGVKLSGDNWVLHEFGTPTPGMENTGGVVAELVDFSVAGKPFVGSMELTLTSRSGSEIIYTTDGKRPSLSNPLVYNGPLTLSETTIISASISGGPVRQEVYFEFDASLSDFSSNLPLVVMQGDGDFDSSWKSMLIGVLEPDEITGRTRFEGEFQTNSGGAARTRGSSTQSFPKKSYRIEFQDEDEEDRSLKPLGMPSESDWILSGRYEEDRALVRNEFTYTLSRQIGRYAARTKFCEVFVHDGEGPMTLDDYVGAYSFMESMKRDGDRIDIEELTPEDNSEPEVSGGYIFKVDRLGPNDTQITGGGMTVRISEPDNSELTSQQESYLRGFLDDMADSFSSSDPETGYPAFIDEGSWIDHHLINTLMLNVDSLRLSTYFYKERNGKVFGGPVWDFNISSGSRDRFADPPRPSVPDVWRGISGDMGTTFFTNGTQLWWGDLFELPDFQQAYCDRWNELRQGAFSTENIIGLIDSMAAELEEAQVRNEDRWPLVLPEYGGYDGEIAHLQEWLTDRVNFIDNELVGYPRVTPAGGPLAAGETVTLEGRGTLFNPTKVYYTLDGTDPRVSGGGISEVAVEYAGPIMLTESATIVAREHLPNYDPEPDGPDQEWSAPARLQFVVGVEAASATNLVLSEMMYHPGNPSVAEMDAGFVNDDDFEFLEFYNPGNAPVDLIGIEFREGIEYELEESFILQPGARAVIVSDMAAFAQRYGEDISVVGAYEGRLMNSGEQLALYDAAGEMIFDFIYDDNDPWPTEPDGSGVSLVLIDPSTAPDHGIAANWQGGSAASGTPGFGESEGPFAQWMATNGFINPLEDSTGLGMSNLMAFATGADLLANPKDALPTVMLVHDSGADYLEFRYRRRTNATDIDYLVQISDDLTNWQPGTTQVSITDNADGTETVTVRPPALTPADVGLFARLRVQLQ